MPSKPGNKRAAESSKGAQKSRRRSRPNPAVTKAPKKAKPGRCRLILCYQGIDTVDFLRRKL